MTELSKIQGGGRMQEILRLAKLRDAESKRRLAELLDEAGMAQDSFQEAEVADLPSVGQVLIEDSVCNYLVHDHVMRIEDALPISLCTEIEVAAERADWSRSSQIDTDTDCSYLSDYRTSSQVRITSDLVGEDVLERLNDVLTEAALFYRCWNKSCVWRACTGWDLLRYTEGQHFGSHCDAVEGTSTARRVLTVLAYVNDDFRGGETRFVRPAIPKTVKPRRGTVVLSPPFYTHPHLSDPVLEGTKIAVLGWMVGQ